MKVVVALMLIGILYSMASGLFFLVHNQEGGKGLVRSLSWRIGLSIALFAGLMIAAAMGWVTPPGGQG